LTATAHTGFARYTYPKSGDRHVLVDLAHVLPTGNGAGVGQQFVSGSISVNNDSSAAPSSTNPSYTGYAEYNGGFNRGPTWRIYFCGTFSQAFDQSKSGVFKYPYDPLNKSNQVTAPPNSNIAVGGLFTWTSGTIIESRIGISFISAEKACGFIGDESPADQTFDQTVEKAKALWNRKCRRRYIAKFVTDSFRRKCP
jgi:putative alpha-1,2-mannosidase